MRDRIAEMRLQCEVQHLRDDLDATRRENAALRGAGFTVGPTGRTEEVVRDSDTGDLYFWDTPTRSWEKID